jgi:uncharacterized protein YndB with AHSA1/START domain
MTGKTRIEIPPGKPTIVLERLFDAPRELVFEAVTRADLVRRWWGFRDSELTECRIDLRPGGAWRIVLRMPDGSTHGFGGVYREIEPPARLVATFRFDGFPEAEAVETTTLEARGSRTLLRVVVLHQSVENRDGHVSSGMEVGSTESHDRLEDLLSSLPRGATGSMH